MTATRQLREAQIRNGTRTDAARAIHHYLNAPGNTSVLGSLDTIRQSLATHSKHRIETLALKSLQARKRHYDTWGHTVCDAVWQWWPYRLRELIADNITPAILAASIIEPSQSQFFHKDLRWQLLMEIKLLEADACEIPMLKRMLVDWTAALDPILQTMEQLTYSILLDVGPEE